MLESAYLSWMDVPNVLFPADAIEVDETFATRESIQWYTKRVMNWANKRKWEALTALVFAQSASDACPINETRLEINWKTGQGVEPILEFCRDNPEDKTLHFQFNDTKWEARMLELYPELPEVDDDAPGDLGEWAELYWNKIDRDGIREWVEGIANQMQRVRGRGYEESAVRTALKRIGHFDQK